MSAVKKPEYQPGLFIKLTANRPNGVILEAFGGATVFPGDILAVRTENGIPFEQAWEMDRSPFWAFCGPNGEDPNPAELEPINDAERAVIAETYMGDKPYYPTHTKEDPGFRSAVLAASVAQSAPSDVEVGSVPAEAVSEPAVTLEVKSARQKTTPAEGIE